MMSKEEKRDAYMKDYYEKNKAKLKAYKSEYYQKNKERLRAKQDKWNQANKEKIDSWHKERRESLKDGFYTIYYLPKHHYVGVTSRLKSRLWGHKNQGRDTSGYTIMYEFSDKRQALDVERKLHEELGFNGKNANYK